MFYASLIPFVLVSLVCYKVLQWVTKERKINALGGRANKVRSYLPFGLDIVCRMVYAGANYVEWELYDSLFRKYGRGQWTMESAVAGRRTIFTAHPENLKAVLATQFGDYGKGEKFHQEWEAFLGDSIFTTDGDKWHASRHLIRPQFIKERVSDLQILETHVQVLLKTIELEGRGKAGGVPGRMDVDMNNLFLRYTLDSATDFLLGSSVDSLENPEQKFAKSFGEVQRVQNMIARAGPLNFLVPRRSYHAGLVDINAFVEPFIERALNLSQGELESKTKSEYTFTHALATFTRDRKMLRDQIVAILLAGRDTTASTLSFTFHELARRPEAVQKLREEIFNTVGLTRPPTYQDLKSMRYLQNAISETLRLYPPVPFNIRFPSRDTTLPYGGGPDGLSPVGVTADTVIVYSTLAMHRRPDLYPSEWTGTRFAPENWEPERWNKWQPKPWTYIPFNGGPRICIGQQFALTEMAYTLVRVLQHIVRIEDLESVEERDRPNLKCEVVMQPVRGVKVGLWTGV